MVVIRKEMFWLYYIYGYVEYVFESLLSLYCPI